MVQLTKIRRPPYSKSRRNVPSKRRPGPISIRGGILVSISQMMLTTGIPATVIGPVLTVSCIWSSLVALNTWSASLVTRRGASYSLSGCTQYRGGNGSAKETPL